MKKDISKRKAAFSCICHFIFHFIGTLTPSLSYTVYVFSFLLQPSGIPWMCETPRLAAKVRFIFGKKFQATVYRLKIATDTIMLSLLVICDWMTFKITPNLLAWFLWFSRFCGQLYINFWFLIHIRVHSLITYSALPPVITCIRSSSYMHRWVLFLTGALIDSCAL